MRSKNILFNNLIKKELQCFYKKKDIHVSVSTDSNYIKISVHSTNDTELELEEKVKKILIKLNIPDTVLLILYVSKEPEKHYKEDRVGMFGSIRRII